MFGIANRNASPPTVTEWQKIAPRSSNSEQDELGEINSNKNFGERKSPPLQSAPSTTTSTTLWINSSSIAQQPIPSTSTCATSDLCPFFLQGICRATTPAAGQRNSDHKNSNLYQKQRHPLPCAFVHRSLQDWTWYDIQFFRTEIYEKATRGSGGGDWTRNSEWNFAGSSLWHQPLQYLPQMLKPFRLPSYLEDWISAKLSESEPLRVENQTLKMKLDEQDNKIKNLEKLLQNKTEELKCFVTTQRFMWMEQEKEHEENNCDAIHSSRPSEAAKKKEEEDGTASHDSSSCQSRFEETDEGKGDAKRREQEEGKEVTTMTTKGNLPLQLVEKIKSSSTSIDSNPHRFLVKSIVESYTLQEQYDWVCLVMKHWLNGDHPTHGILSPPPQQIQNTNNKNRSTTSTSSSSSTSWNSVSPQPHHNTPLFSYHRTPCGHFTPSTPSPSCFGENSVCVCESWKRFQNGLHQLGFANVKELIASGEYCFGFHGTHADNLSAIACGGWDTSRRSGQAYGPGEYFGATFSTSASYSKGSNHNLVVLIIRREPFTKIHGSSQVIVVNNPKDHRAAYVLPLMIVTDQRELRHSLHCLTPRPSSTASNSNAAVLSNLYHHTQLHRFDAEALPRKRGTMNKMMMMMEQPSTTDLCDEDRTTLQTSLSSSSKKVSLQDESSPSFLIRRQGKKTTGEEKVMMITPPFSVDTAAPTDDDEEINKKNEFVKQNEKREREKKTEEEGEKMWVVEYYDAAATSKNSQKLLEASKTVAAGEKTKAEDKKNEEQENPDTTSLRGRWTALPALTSFRVVLQARTLPTQLLQRCLMSSPFSMSSKSKMEEKNENKKSEHQEVISSFPSSFIVEHLMDGVPYEIDLKRCCQKNQRTGEETAIRFCKGTTAE